MWIVDDVDSYSEDPSLAASKTLLDVWESKKDREDVQEKMNDVNIFDSALRCNSCGYEHRVFDSNSPFIKVEARRDHPYNVFEIFPFKAEGKEVDLYACPSCGTIRLTEGYE
jgi:hypothetical protein